MKLIVGLGNPGLIYEKNRHNIGFLCVNHLARNNGIRFDKKQGLARTGAGEIAGNEVLLARPQTGMNISGQSVIKLVKRLKITPDDLLVIHDDLDLPLGKIRIQYGRSSGGHHGIESIMDELESQEFYRIKVGIGRPSEIPDNYKEAEVIDYVLGDFTSEEKEIVLEVILRVSEAVICLLTEGLQTAMNKYN